MFFKHGIILTVGIYAINTEGKLGTLQKDVMTFINNQPDVLQSHGFYYYSDKNLVTIDIIPNESVHDDNVFAEEMKEKLNKQFPDYLKVKTEYKCYICIVINKTIKKILDYGCS